jgi:hypothetical protein
LCLYRSLLYRPGRLLSGFNLPFINLI